MHARSSVRVYPHEISVICFYPLEKKGGRMDPFDGTAMRMNSCIFVSVFLEGMNDSNENFSTLMTMECLYMRSKEIRTK